VAPPATRDPHDPPGRGRPGRRERGVAALVALAGWAAVTAALQISGATITRRDVAINWQIDSIPNLVDNPFTSSFYRHVQPPLYNLFIGVVLRWSPFPKIGTLWVLWLLALAGCGLLLADLLVRLRVPGPAAGAIAALALANPNLLATMPIASYEVPIALLLLAALRVGVTLPSHPSARRWLAFSALLTALALTRSLFHPVWVLAVLGLVALVRPPSRRTLLVAFALPIVLVGGWMLKNQVLFGQATTSSWLGFNMTRGVTATMTHDQVERAVADGNVSRLALEYPWGQLDQYRAWTGGCVPGDRHASLSDLVEPEHGGANFNNECFLPVYRQAERDARALIERYPGRYLVTRWEPIRWSFATAALGFDDVESGFAGGDVARPTWMDRFGDRWLLPIDAVSNQRDWNLPLLAVPEVPGRISLTLAALYVVVVGRGGLGALRLAGSLRRRLRGRRSGSGDEPEAEDGTTAEVGARLADGRDGEREGVELLWCVLGLTALMVVVGGALLEYGENGRFRAVLDPLLVGLPLGAAWRVAADRLAARRSGEGEDGQLVAAGGERLG